MNGKYLLDTNVIIDYLGGREDREQLGEMLAGAERYASVITRMELLSSGSLTAEDTAKIQRFLDDLAIIPLDEEIERAAVAIRRAAHLKLPDAIVVASAQVREATLVTRDQRLLALSLPGTRVIENIE